MAYIPQVWVDDETEIDQDHMEHIEQGIKNAYNVSLIAISDTAPSECSTGDKYYNTTTKEIYVATATDTWSAEGETPLEDILYVLFNDNTTYAWDGEDLISVGGGSGGSNDIVVIGSESDTTEDTKLLVDTSEQEATLKHKDENSGTFVDTLSAYVNKKIENALKNDFIVVYNNATQTITGNNTFQKYNFNTIAVSQGSKLTFNSTNKSIVIGTGVEYIELSAQLYVYENQVSAIKDFRIMRKRGNTTTQIKRSIYRLLNTMDYQSMVLPSSIVAVEEGDELTIEARSGSGNLTFASANDGDVNFLSIKVIN